MSEKKELYEIARLPWGVQEGIPEPPGFPYLDKKVINDTYNFVESELDTGILGVYCPLIYYVYEPNSKQEAPIAFENPQGRITIILSRSVINQGCELVFQLSHELCHCYFYSRRGLPKGRACTKDENYCAAMSLFTVEHLFPDWTEYYRQVILHNNDPGYPYLCGYALFDKFRKNYKEFVADMKAYYNTISDS